MQTVAICHGLKITAVAVEGVGDDVFLHAIAEVAVEPGADVFVNRLQFDKDKRKTIDETDEVGSSIIARSTQAGELQFPHRKESIVSSSVSSSPIFKIDDPRPDLAKLAQLVFVAHRHPVADELVKIPVVLEHCPSEVVPGHLAHRFGDGRGW